MGTQVVTEIIWRVRQLIHDSAGSRWDDTEMLKWLNDSLLETVLHKPTANSKRVTLNLVTGTVQALPATAVQLLRISHNKTSSTSIRIIDQDRLDAADPSWRVSTVATQTVDVQHYMYDALVPKEFHVYPANYGSGQLEATVSETPPTISTMASIFPLEDIYGPAIVDYLLYRAYSKHSKFAGNEQRASNAYNRYLQQLGTKFQAETAIQPNTTNKNPQTGVE